MGLRPLLLPDEGRYGDVARQMLHGSPWVPLLDGLPFFHKPPLLYWLDMAAMWLFGVSPFTARFGAFVGAWVMGAAVYLALRRWQGVTAARTALVVLGTAPFFFFSAQYANTDMLVGGMITATVLAFVRAFEAPKFALRWLVVAWVFAALSVLAKGLIGLVLPMLIVGPWLMWQRRWMDVLRALHPLGLLAFAVVALPWMVAMQLKFPRFFDYFIVEQHFRRFEQTSFNNVQPIWFYWIVLPLACLPWSSFLARVRRADPAGPVGQGFWLWWIVAVLGFFSLPSSKIVGYALPALAPFCLLLAGAAGRFPRWRRGAVIAAVALDLVAVGVLVVKTPHTARPAAQAIAAQVKPGDRVVFVDELFYDLPFYLDLKDPVVIAANWDPAFAQSRDNWRKEVFDAGRFDPERAKRLLWPIARIGEMACHPQPVWFVSAPATTDWLKDVPALQTVYTGRDLVVRRASGRCG